MKRYVDITKDEFEQFLLNQSNIDCLKFERKIKWNEYVYDLYVKDFLFKFRIRSSIDTRTEHSTDCGNDAIRIVPFHSDDNNCERPLLERVSRAYRTKGWKNNVIKKMLEIRNKLLDNKFSEISPAPRIKDGYDKLKEKEKEKEEFSKLYKTLTPYQQVILNHFRSPPDSKGFFTFDETFWWIKKDYPSVTKDYVKAQIDDLVKLGLVIILEDSKNIDRIKYRIAPIVWETHGNGN